MRRAALVACALAAGALAACALAAGCSSKTAVNLTLTLGGDVAARAGEVASLVLHVDGDSAPFDRTLDVHGRFAGGRETLQYLPGVGSGTLTFDVTLASDGGETLGHGSAATPLKSNAAVPLTIPIGAALDADGAMPDDLSGADLSPAPDMAQPACARIQVSTFAGTGAAGYMDGAGNVAKFQNLEGVTVDPSGTLYAVEATRVRKILADATVSTFATGFLGARRISRTNVGGFHVVDVTNDEIWRVDSAGMTAQLYLIGGVFSVTDANTLGTPYSWDTQTCDIWSTNASNMPVRFSGATGAGSCGFVDGDANTAKFASVTDMVADSANVLWVADSGNFRIRRVATDGSVTTLAGSTQGSADGTGAAAQFQTLQGITIDDAAHVLYVTDGTTIRSVTMGGVVTTLAGTTSGIVDGSGCVAKFGALKGVTYFAGALYAVDVERIRKIVLP